MKRVGDVSHYAYFMVEYLCGLLSNMFGSRQVFWFWFEGHGTPAFAVRTNCVVRDVLVFS